MCSTPKILKMFLISNMKKLLNLILSLLHSVEWLIIVSLFWKLLLYLHKFEFHKHVPSNCKTLSDLFYQNRPHLSKAGTQGEKIERFWKKACSRRRLRWSYRLRGQRPLALYQRGSRGERTQGPATKPEEKKSQRLHFSTISPLYPFQFHPTAPALASISPLYSPLYPIARGASNIKNGRGGPRTHAAARKSPPSFFFPCSTFKFFTWFLKSLIPSRRFFSASFTIEVNLMQEVKKCNQNLPKHLHQIEHHDEGRGGCFDVVQSIN